MARRRPEDPEKAAYEAQRLQAAEEKITTSMNRRLGYAVPPEYNELPDRTDNQFDPRRW